MPDQNAANSPDATEDFLDAQALDKDLALKEDPAAREAPLPSRQDLPALSVSNFRLSATGGDTLGTFDVRRGSWTTHGCTLLRDPETAQMYVLPPLRDACDGSSPAVSWPASDGTAITALAVDRWEETRAMFAGGEFLTRRQRGASDADPDDAFDE